MFRRQSPDPAALDTSSRHSVLIESEHPDHLLVSHFYHAGRFWKANIPLAATNSVFGQAFNFSPVATRKTPKGREVIYNHRGQPKPRFSFINHLQCRFRLDPEHPIELYDSDAEVSGPAKHKIDDFVYSVEAVGPRGVPFDFKNGLMGTLICAHRFLSTQEMVFERVVVQGQYVWESPPLPLEASERRSVLQRSIHRSDQAAMNEVYYLYRCCGTNNCTSNPFRIVDQSVNYTIAEKIGSLIYRIPLNPRLYLRIRGLDSDPDFYKLVRSEFEEFIALPETQQRKRDFVRAAIRDRRAAQADGS